ncbi:MAG: OmpW/AlkL family protein [Rhizomicrobium sp.]
MKKFLLAGFVMSAAVVALPAYAADSPDDGVSPWFFRVGAAELQNLDGLDATVGGQPLAGAALHYHHIFTALLEVGYSFMPDWSAVLSVGLPPAISVYGGGSIAGVGKLESTTFGPSAFTIQYQPFHDGMFRPYVGAGGSYLVIFSTHDAALQNAKLGNDLSPEVEAGTDIMFEENLGLFVEVKKAWLTSHATGTFNGLPFNGTANISPWVYSTGVTLHF